MIKKLLFIIATSSLSHSAYCLTYTCDSSVVFAMSKQRDALEKRLGDIRQTIASMRNEQNKLNKLCVLETYEMTKMRERKRIELWKQKHSLSITKRLQELLSKSVK